jgi:hypothetical protein
MMRTIIPLLIFLAALGVTAPAAADLYKWVDERGVTNYSNAPPAAASSKSTRVDNTISVYTPDEPFMQAVKALRERTLKALSEPEPPRSPVARISAPPQSGYEKCLLSGRLGCDDLYGNNYYHAYLPGVAVRPVRGVQPVFFPSPRPPAAHPDNTRASRISPAR